MTMHILLKLALILPVAFASGCTSDDYTRTEGLTPGAGNAMAANTAMQMVDPWQNGVQDTKLLVPTARGATAGAADQAAAAKGSQDSTSSSN
jgi:hypothetical protein